jgi:hypothetical protein
MCVRACVCVIRLPFIDGRTFTDETNGYFVLIVIFLGLLMLLAYWNHRAMPDLTRQFPAGTAEALRTMVPEENQNSSGQLQPSPQLPLPYIPTICVRRARCFTEW